MAKQLHPRARLAAPAAIFLGMLSLATAVDAAPPSRATFPQLAVQAKEASDANRLEEAVRLYTKALAMRPAWADGRWALGNLEYDLDHYDRAAAHFQKLIALQPRNGTAYAMLGLCEFELGREDSSLRHIQKAKSLGLDQGVEVWRVLLYHEGMLLQRRGNFEAARDTLEQLCLQGGQSNAVSNVLGMALLRVTDKAPPQASPDADVVLRIGRAECLAGQKKYEDARAGFEQAVQEHSDFHDIHYAYGLFLLELRDIAGGVEQLKLEIANNPRSVLARLRIAAVLYKVDSPAALPYARQAVELDPKPGFGHYLLGLLLLDTNDAANAVTELELAEKSLPNEPKLYLALGSAYSRVGRSQDAARARATFERLNKKAAAAQPGDELKLGGALPETSEPAPAQHVPR